MDQTTMNYDQWIGRDAYDTTGDKIGEITDIYYDDVSQRPEWVAVKAGIFKGSRLVPISGSQIFRSDKGEDHLQVPFTTDQVKSAPDVDPEGHLTPAEESALYAHYNFDWKDSSATNYGYGKDYRKVSRADRDFRYQPWDRTRSDWAETERGHEEIVAEATAVSETVQKVPETETVRLRKYRRTEMVPVTKEEVRVEKGDVQTQSQTQRRNA
jgi:sporulation protein YlmC with PRC-barrel domain